MVDQNEINKNTESNSWRDRKIHQRVKISESELASNNFKTK